MVTELPDWTIYFWGGGGGGGGGSLLSIYNNDRFEFVRGDLRRLTDIERALEGVDAVVHLAAIVGDPACAKQPELAREINWNGSQQLYDLCSKSSGVRTFVFASTCSNYGKMENVEYTDETSPLRPASLYAELKVQFEEYVRNTPASNGMTGTSLRFSTVFGLSPRMRFDLTVNEFIRDVALGRELVVYGEQFWRPYCHVDDLASACELILNSHPDLIANNIYGVGDTNQNFQKKTIVDEFRKIVPSAKIKYVEKLEDPRDYRVDFSMIKNDLDFQITKSVPEGLVEIWSAINDGLFSDPYDIKYKNVVD